MAARKIYVRVAEPHLNFVKEDITSDEEAEFVRIQVFGFDELGDPTMPVFEVPAIREINNAINNEQIIEFDEKGNKITKFKGRLIEVEDRLVGQFPMWIGHPTPQMSVEEIVNVVLAIRSEQVKGDAILGKTRKPYSVRRDLFDHDKDYDRYEQLINQGQTVVVPENPVAVKTPQQV
jgi:hypothetical protein